MEITVPRFYVFGTTTNKGVNIEDAILWHDVCPPPLGDGPLAKTIPCFGNLQPAPRAWLGAGKNPKRWPDCVMGSQTHIPGFFHRRVIDAFIKHGITGYWAVKVKVEGGSALRKLAPEPPDYYWIIPSEQEKSWPTRVHTYKQGKTMAFATPADWEWQNSRDEAPDEIYQRYPTQHDPLLFDFRTIVISEWNGLDFSAVRPKWAAKKNGGGWTFWYGSFFCSWRVKAACDAEGLKLGFSEMALPNGETELRSM